MNQNPKPTNPLFDCFRSFVDEKTFKRFLRSCNLKARQKGELTFSQQAQWQNFISENPQFSSTDFETIISTFQFCHIHVLPLEKVRIPVNKGLGDVRFSEEYEAMCREYPHPYSSEWVLDSSAWGDATHVDGFHCNECLAVKKRLSELME